MEALRRASATGAERSSVELRRRQDGVEVRLHVRPRSAQDCVGGTHDGALQVRVRAAPSEGAANAALCRALARALGVRPAAVALLSGHKGRRKWVCVRGEPEALSSELARLARSERVV